MLIRNLNFCSGSFFLYHRNIFEAFHWNFYMTNSNFFCGISESCFSFFSANVFLLNSRLFHHSPCTQGKKLVWQFIYHTTFFSSHFNLFDKYQNKCPFTILAIFFAIKAAKNKEIIAKYEKCNADRTERFKHCQRAVETG